MTREARNDIREIVQLQFSNKAVSRNQKMRFVRELHPEVVGQVTQPPVEPQSEELTSPINDGLTDIDGVASALGISRRYVQSLVKRKVIPVIRLGRRCTRFDLTRVLAAVKKYEIIEIGRK